MVVAGTVTLNSQSYLLLNDDDGGPQSAGVRASEKKQDLTPSTRDVTQGIPGDTDIASGSKIVYGDASGSFGLSDRTLAPGDMARPFLSDVDNTRMRQLTSWVGTAATTALGTRNLSGSILSSNYALVDAAGGFGFVALSASATTDFWQYDTASSAFKIVATRTGYTAPAAPWLAGTVPRFNQGTLYFPPQTVTDYADGLWYSAGGGLQNLALAPVAVVGDANTVATVKYLDMLWSLGITTSGITITPYRFNAGQTPATAGAQVQKIDTEPGSATYGTAVNTTYTIRGEKALLGAVAGESNVFLVTDRSLYRIGWNDAPENTFQVTRLPVEVPQFTSNPVWWNGELWVGAGGQIVHVIPGQRWADMVTVDAVGNTPQPFSGRVIQLMASQQYLCAKLITDLTSNPQDTAIALRNSDGSWYNRRLIQSNTFTAQLPMLQKLDANGFALATFTSTSTTTAWPLLGAGKNPNNLATSLRGQEGTERIIWPWEYGEDEASIKQLKRCRLQVKGVGAVGSSNHIKALFQVDGGDQLSDGINASFLPLSATFTGIAKGMGRWVQAADAYDSARGDYGSQLSGANGFIWTEFDGTSPYLNPNVSAGAIQTPVPIVYGGANFTSTPTLYALPAPGFAGTGATFTCTVAGGAITSVTCTAGGAGYTNGEVWVLASGGKTDNGLTSGSPFRAATPLALGIYPFPYPTWHGIRWMAEIGGDTSGTLVPTFVALLFEFNEYSKVEYQYAIRIRMRVGDTHIKNGTKADGSDKSLYDTPAAIVAARDALEALKNQHLIVPYTGLDAHTWNVLVTKVTHDTIAVDSTGIQESETELTLQIQQLLGTV